MTHSEMRAELDRRNIQRVQWHHREATINRLLAQVQAERDNLREENERLRLVARLAAAKEQHGA